MTRQEQPAEVVKSCVRAEGHILKAKKLVVPFQPDMSNFEAIEAFSLISAKALAVLV